MAKKKKSTKSAVGAYDLYKQILGGSSTSSGKSVTWKTALRVSTALACARVIAEGIAQVPFKLFRDRQDGRGKDPAKDHPLYDVLHLRPNEWQTSFELREQIGLHLGFKNNAYIYKVRGLRDRVVELLPFEPDRVRVERDGFERKYFVWLQNGEQMPVSAENMWHIRGPSWNGVDGLNLIDLAREVLGLSLATEEHGARMFSNGAKPGGVLSTDSMLQKEDVDALRAAWQEAQGGNENAYKTAVLFGGLKFQSMAMTGVDAQHLEQRRFQVEEVCRGYRVLPIMVGHSDKTATYASAEQMFLAHLVHTMMPWYERIEQSATVNLLSEKERSEGLYAKFITNGLMRGTMKDRAEYYNKMYQVGALNPNQILGFEDMNPYEGGDEYRVPMNMEPPGKTEEDATNENA